VPRGHEIRRTLKRRVSVGAGLSVLEPGRIIDDFPNVKLYFGAKEGNWLHDVVALDYSNPKVDRMIRAEKALVEQDGADVKLELYRMTVDPLDEKHPTMARFNRFVYTIKGVLTQGDYIPGVKDMGFFPLVERIRALTKLAATAEGDPSVRFSPAFIANCELSWARIEFSKRFVFAMASICFVLIGIPLGIRSQRKESSIGMAISLAVSLGYYIVVILSLSLDERFSLHPEYIIWLPVAICLALAARFTRRHL
jgi:lipopolysaccharide export system permease protein